MARGAGVWGPWVSYISSATCRAVTLRPRLCRSQSYSRASVPTHIAPMLFIGGVVGFCRYIVDVLQTLPQPAIPMCWGPFGTGWAKGTISPTQRALPLGIAGCTSLPSHFITQRARTNPLESGIPRWFLFTGGMKGNAFP